jgi:hypothetical protein
MPEGDLGNAAGLAAPSPDLRRWIARLVAVTGARLRLRPPPLGAGSPSALGPALLAAAIGANRLGERAALLLRAVPPPRQPADLLAHHGIVAPALTRVPKLGDQLRDLSPLTGVLDRPGPRTYVACESLFEDLMENPEARPMLVARFAEPAQHPEQAGWRGECLTDARYRDAEFVLDVYQNALLHHGREHEIGARAAWQYVLADQLPDTVRATATWWRALAELEAAEPRRVRERNLDRRRVGTNLFRRVQLLEAA